jgi:hypothetical protein
MGLLAMLSMSMLASAANSPDTNAALGQLQAVAKYCDQITKGEKIDIKDVMKYLSSEANGKSSCPSCDAMVSEAKGTPMFKSTYESTMLVLAKINLADAKNACHDVQKSR